jgi:SAM-dependent methyltransferase
MSSNNPTSREVYTHGYSRDAQGVMASRTAAYAMRFLRPYLRPGVRVLDCGCGPGSITVDLAEIVAPGKIIGVDMEPSQVEAARALATERRIGNVSFEVANVYDLPFPDASFDVAVAHTVIEHLREPVQALREMRRVLRPDGLVGIRSGDVGTAVMEPASAGTELFLALWQKVWRHNGGDPSRPRHLRRLLREAGYSRTVGSSSAGEQIGSIEASRHFAGVAVRYTGIPTWNEVVLEHGWADPAALDAMRADLTTWGEHPDAFYGVLYCEAIGWIGDGAPERREWTSLYDGES